jgi:hypothetical protein
MLFGTLLVDLRSDKPISKFVDNDEVWKFSDPDHDDICQHNKWLTTK